MQKLLEDYLNEVTQTLGSLPKVRKADELREIRAHLLSAFSVHQEAGQSEEEAARATVEQFGLPQFVGAGILSAWRRERRLDALKVLGSAIATPVIIGSLIYLLNFVLQLLLEYPVNNGFLRIFFLRHGTAFVFSLNWLMYGLAGAILGVLVPKQAVRGTLLIVILPFIHLAWIVSRPVLTEPRQYSVCASDLALTLTSVFCAWLVSRRRLGRQVRTSTSAS